MTGSDFLFMYVRGLLQHAAESKSSAYSSTVLSTFTAIPATPLAAAREMLEFRTQSDEVSACPTSISPHLVDNELFESGGFGPLPSQPLLKELAENQQKHILRIPGPVPRTRRRCAPLSHFSSPAVSTWLSLSKRLIKSSQPPFGGALMEEVARALSSDEALMIFVTESAKKYPSLAISIARGAAKDYHAWRQQLPPQ